MMSIIILHLYHKSNNNNLYVYLFILYIDYIILKAKILEKIFISRYISDIFFSVLGCQKCINENVIYKCINKNI